MKNNQTPKLFKKIVLALITLFAAISAFGVLLIATLAITEYKPADTEVLSIQGAPSKTLAAGDSFTIMTWNIGYGALGDYADFFMDGGKGVNTSTKKQVQENMSAITDEIKTINPDVIFLQEIDQKSKRSHYMNEAASLADSLTGYQSSFANNYKVLYIPYPLPPIGKVDAGIMTLTSYQSTSAIRESLPCPFKSLIRLGNLKRCVLISRIPLEDSDKELVLVNLHLEAYDDGDGKEAQTELLRQILKNEAEKGNYVIAGGDFNQSFSNIDTSSYPLVDSNYWQCGEIDTDSFGDMFEFVMDNSAPTCRSLDKAYAGSNKESFQYYMIDGFIVSSNLSVNSIKTEDLQFKNTDHNPVIMNVTLQ